MTDIASRAADTDAPLIDPLIERWSPRAFDPEAVVPEAQLKTMLEAARWAPSAANTQPWRFIVARRGEAAFDAIHETMRDFNRVWADRASVLIANVARTVGDDGTPMPWGLYDLGQAVAHLTIQAQHDGLHTHQMGGFDADAIAAAFGLGEGMRVVSVTAVGMLGPIDELDERFLARESAPRTRLPLAEIVIRPEG
ncbi:nitroreductase family protein [Agromyces archimandritae]|uniref:nitroreductase family protein n=1 Tax=Agromyces archimandritae TaxID=2781962 RepID=UPI001FCFBC70|nr:nitroreductase family protein [Agromyces archimandritae]